VVVEEGLVFLPRGALDHNLLTYASHVAVNRELHHTAGLFTEMESC
jgi:hypothetical protein